MLINFSVYKNGKHRVPNQLRRRVPNPARTEVDPNSVFEFILTRVIRPHKNKNIFHIKKLFSLFQFLILHVRPSCLRLRYNCKWSIIDDHSRCYMHIIEHGHHNIRPYYIIP
jgi:hypothetical protein